MKVMKVTLKDGSSREIPVGQTVGSALSAFGLTLGPEILAAKVNGQMVDLSHPLTEDAEVIPLQFGSAEGREVYRHSSTHIMAQAVKEVFPTAQLTIGPALEDGFFYDFAFERPFTPEDLEKIEARAKEIIKRALHVKQAELSKQDAVKLFQERGETYKVELIQGLADGQTISVYSQGEFVDLCRGPHLPTTGHVGAFKLLNTAGAYWRGDERNPMLQRVYGTAFPTQKELEEHLKLLEEAKARDHRKLGNELDLFLFHEWAPAMPFFLPRGAHVYNKMIEFMRDLYVTTEGYEEVIT